MRSRQQRHKLRRDGNRKRVLLAVYDECRHRKGTQSVAPIVALTTEPSQNDRSGRARHFWRREEASELSVGEPRGIHRARIGGVDFRIWSREGSIVNLIEREPLGWAQPLANRLSKGRHPRARRTDRVNGDELLRPGLIHGGREHGDTSAP